jgi:hypothetical protein
MKRQVVCDRSGLLLATAPARLVPSGTDAPVKAMIVPGSGQLVHVVDVPRDLEGLEFASLRRQFRVNLRGKARLTKIPAPKAKPAEPAPPAAPARQAPRRKPRR